MAANLPGFLAHHSSLCLRGQIPSLPCVYCLPFGFFKRTLAIGFWPIQMMQDDLLIPKSLTSPVSLLVLPLVRPYHRFQDRISPWGPSQSSPLHSAFIYLSMWLVSLSISCLWWWCSRQTVCLPWPEKAAKGWGGVLTEWGVLKINVVSETSTSLFWNFSISTALHSVTILSGFTCWLLPYHKLRTETPYVPCILSYKHTEESSISYNHSDCAKLCL